MSGAVAAVGTFDGVHRGHMAVLGKVAELARREGDRALAFTFDRHPLALIAPGRAPGMLTTVADRKEQLGRAGVEAVVLGFDEGLRGMTALEWMRRLHDEYGVHTLVVGYDNTFGSDGISCTVADYREKGKLVGIDIVGAPEIEGISSSAVRRAVLDGRVEDAREMLGRRWSLPGIVVEGNKLGRTIGFPTANLQPEPGLVLPADGVYAAWAVLPGGKRVPAVVNIGRRPTVMRGDGRTVEAHLIDWSGDLYGKRLRLVFARRLRDEQRFGSIESLRAQIEKDAARAKDFLGSEGTQTK